MYAEILFPLHIKGQPTLTYRIPEGMKDVLRPGQIVKAELKRQLKIGTVVRTHEKEPPYKTPYRIKEISELVSSVPLLQPWQIRLMLWISDYYRCPLYRVMKAFVPVKVMKEPPPLSGVRPPEFQPQKETGSQPFLTLTDDQKTAVKKILEAKKPVLLFGITGSGKTEIYLHAILEAVKQDGQALLLVPEIALTPQFISYFRKFFSHTVTLIHSRLTKKERFKNWQNIRSGNVRLVIGSRSALFSPFQNLKLVVMDEEHEPSYKQDSNPRYHARDVILKMKEFLPDLKVVLGSATPSIETFYAAKQDEYELITLPKRIHDTSLPTVDIVDMRDEMKKGNFSPISELLQTKISETLKIKKQAILFLNRRGANSAVICRDCGYSAKCKKCSVALTYHKNGKLICHHCGYVTLPPATCPHCQGVRIRYVGIGTQKIEEEIQKLFPQARLARIDRDVIKKNTGLPLEKIYENILSGTVDIVIGTQMIGKGLHFPSVQLVGVILADMSLYIPDFRSSERTFQLLTQVGGRAGREVDRGEVVIQTYLPEHFALRAAESHDYLKFYEEEMTARKLLNLPPFSRIVKLTIKNKDAEQCRLLTKKLYEQLIKTFGALEAASLSMYPALIQKLHGKYRYHILIKGENSAELLKNVELPPDVRIDVDPMATV